MLKKIINIILISTTLLSCTSVKQDINKLTKIDKEIVAIKKPLTDKSKVYVDAAIEILKKDKVTNELTLRLLLNAQTIIGVPKNVEKLDVTSLINKDPFSLSSLAALEKKDNEDIKKLEVLETKKEELKDKIITEVKKDIAEQKSWWQRLKDGITHYIMLTGIIIFVLLIGPSILKAVFNISLSFTPLGFLRNLFK